MFLNFILVAVGLTICFGGIYFRRVCSAIMGFFWGALTALLLMLLLSTGRTDETGVIVAMVLLGAVVAWLSAAFYKLCAAINGFLYSLVIAMFLLALLMNSVITGVVLFLAALIGLAVAWLCYRFYDMAFMIVTAFSGAFVASVGGYAMGKGWELEELLYELMWRGFERLYPIIWITIALGVVGLFVQRRRFGYVREQEEQAKKKESPAEPLPGDGLRSQMQAAAAASPAGPAETASPTGGAETSAADRAAVGAALRARVTAAPPKPAPAQDAPGWCPYCGTHLDGDEIFCAVCGHKLK